MRRHEKALARLGELEESADVATHDLTCAALREERDRAVEAWQRLVIARGLVADRSPASSASASPPCSSAQQSTSAR